MTPILAVAALTAQLTLAAPTQAPLEPIRRVQLDKSRVVFDDGDTIHYTFMPGDGMGDAIETIELRLLGFDTPETIHPHHGIFCDQPLGKQASALARKVITEAQILEILTRGERDKYDRILAHLIVDGRNLAVIQIEAGLAYEGILYWGDNGFPEQYADILAAWNNRSPINRALQAGRTPDFIAPYKWKQAHQQKTTVPLDRWNAMSRAEKDRLAAAAGCPPETPASTSEPD